MPVGITLFCQQLYCMILSEQCFHPGHNHVQGSGIVTTFRNDNVGVALGWLDEFQVHRADSMQILFDHGIGRSPAFVDVPLQAADESEVGIRIHEDLDVEHFPERRFGEDQDALHKNDIAWLDSERLGGAAVCGEIIDWHFDGPSVAKSGDVPDQEICFEGVGMIKVELIALRRWEPAQILVIGIVLEKCDAVCPDTLQDGLGDSGFPRTRATRDANDERVWMFHGLDYTCKQTDGFRASFHLTSH
jgi:hypothetical protein